jgi:glycosyltransferase involved in cell wall biosynthesis
LQYKKKIFICIDWFEPAYKAGGPIRSVANLVKSLDAYYQIFILTSNKDLNDTASMAGIETNNWTSYANNARVYYANHAHQSWKIICQLLQEVQPHYIYCNSMFSTYYTLYPLLIKKIRKISGQVILSPKGMLKPSALSFKPLKKKLFLYFFRLLNLHKLVWFHASDQAEVENIEKQFGKTTIFPIPDSPAALPTAVASIHKKRESLKLIFIGRIHPIKQLHLVIESIKPLQNIVTLTILGTIENEDYWQQCKNLIHSFDTKTAINFVGEQPHHQMLSFINNHHVFILPTMGENFGHAIYEALGAGRPVIISDQTPWQELAIQQAGFNIPLNQMNTLSHFINQTAQWNQEEYNTWSHGARRYIEKYLQQNNLVSAYQKLFN